MIDPEERPTVAQLFDHPFLIMTKFEARESKEASVMMSLFSLFASQATITEFKANKQ